MSREPWYNSKKGIEKSVKTLTDFSKLLEARSAAVRDQTDKLDEFVVFGIYLLNTQGGCTRSKSIHQPEPPKKVPVVLTRREWDRQTVRSYFELENVFHPIPHPKIHCHHCGIYWNIRNVHDIVFRINETPISLAEYEGKTFDEVNTRFRESRDKRQILFQWGRKYSKDNVIQKEDNGVLRTTLHFHTKCLLEWITQKTIREYRDAFVKAGFQKFDLFPADKVQFDGHTEFYGPRMLIDTELGEFKIGWRTRVMEIKWEDVLRRQWKLGNLPERFILDIFEGEKATMDLTYIHADDMEKTTDYLGRLYKYFSRKGK